MNTRRVLTLGALLAGAALSVASVPAGGQRRSSSASSGSGSNASAVNSRMGAYERAYQNYMREGDRQMRRRAYHASHNNYVRAAREARSMVRYLRNLSGLDAGNENVRRGNLRKSNRRLANATDAATLMKGELGIQRAASYVRQGRTGMARNQLMRVADNMNRLQRRTMFRGVRTNARNAENRAARALRILENRR